MRVRSGGLLFVPANVPANVDLVRTSTAVEPCDRKSRKAVVGRPPFFVNVAHQISGRAPDDSLHVVCAEEID